MPYQICVGKPSISQSDFSKGFRLSRARQRGEIDRSVSPTADERFQFPGL